MIDRRANIDICGGANLEEVKQEIEPKSPTYQITPDVQNNTLTQNNATPKITLNQMSPGQYGLMNQFSHSADKSIPLTDRFGSPTIRGHSITFPDFMPEEEDEEEEIEVP